MTRIIGGVAGGRRLKTPSGDSTRPTSDRVREAMFSTIDSGFGSMHGLRFLDLYAGSGAVGLEAMSRGAGEVTLVEQDRSTASLIRANAQALGFTVDVVTAAVSRALARPPQTPYDIAFLDPPYSLETAAVSDDLAALVTNGWLVPGALLVVERASRDGVLAWPEGVVGERSRKYGETTLWYGHASGPTQGP